ncbi:hypothetical protein BDN72DRAFT_906095 [Pluteus cervinus]|uniref:Uncharacterized protein n=1 Tax=Pluteus cervinus TaxID=181527 RepID=A0ACD3A1A3_9AGAR|nr:hypothetical protein BDN72DRAFT_906095 [Pluteus cervinus]
MRLDDAAWTLIVVVVVVPVPLLTRPFYGIFPISMTGVITSSVETTTSMSGQRPYNSSPALFFRTSLSLSNSTQIGALVFMLDVESSDTIEHQSKPPNGGSTLEYSTEVDCGGKYECRMAAKLRQGYRAVPYIELKTSNLVPPTNTVNAALTCTSTVSVVFDVLIRSRDGIYEFKNQARSMGIWDRFSPYHCTSTPTPVVPSLSRPYTPTSSNGGGIFKFVSGTTTPRTFAGVFYVQGAGRTRDKIHPPDPSSSPTSSQTMLESVFSTPGATSPPQPWFRGLITSNPPLNTDGAFPTHLRLSKDTIVLPSPFPGTSVVMYGVGTTLLVSQHLSDHHDRNPTVVFFTALIGGVKPQHLRRQPPATPRRTPPAAGTDDERP